MPSGSRTCSAGRIATCASCSRRRPPTSTTTSPPPCSATPTSSGCDDRPDEMPPDAAARFVASDGTDRRWRPAYEALTPSAREALHDERAVQLAAHAADEAVRLGALPYHLARGSDPHGRGVEALLAALEHCVLMGFYHRVIELGREALDAARLGRPAGGLLARRRQGDDRADRARPARRSRRAVRRRLRLARRTRRSTSRPPTDGRCCSPASTTTPASTTGGPRRHINTAIAISQQLPRGRAAQLQPDVQRERARPSSRCTSATSTRRCAW